jgi:Domain of unknown function (DUF4160)
MPTVLRWSGYRAYFVSHDCREPPHVHVDRGGCSAKVWLQPVAVARNIGYAAHEVTEILQVLSENRDRIVEIWNEHCGRASAPGSRR